MIKVNQELRDYLFTTLDTVINNEETIQKINTMFFDNSDVDKVENELLDIKNKYYFRVSQLVSCPRKEYFRNIGFKSQINAKEYFILSMGNDLHKRMQAILSILSLLVGKEELLIKQFENYYIVGHYDGIINFNNVKSLIEIKTMSPYAFQKIGAELAKVELDYKLLDKDMGLYRYLKQANTYIYMFIEQKKQYDIANNLHWLIFVNKASVKGVPPIFTLQFKYDESLALDTFNTAKLIYTYLNNKTMPDPSLNWECFYCGYTNCEYNKKGGNDYV